MATTNEFNHWAQIAAAYPKACGLAVRKTAADGQANVQAKIRENDQIDTGYMFDSVYFVTSEKSTYKGGDKSLPEVARPARETEAYVAVAAQYAIYQNNGTRFQAARPFFEPAIQKTQASFEKALQAIEASLGNAAR